MSGLVVALVGPDGVGKTTISRRLAGLLEDPVHRVYAGDNPEDAERMLATTRLVWWCRRRAGHGVTHGPPVPRRRRHRSLPGRLLQAPRVLALLAAQCGEEWSRLHRARRLARAGAVVVLDRSYLHDYYRHDVDAPGRSPAQRLHGWWLRRMLPRPELSVFLDAPVALLHARKPEGSIEDLRRRREEYRDLEGLTSGWVRVDAGGDLDAVAAAVADAVRGFRRERQ